MKPIQEIAMTLKGSKVVNVVGSSVRYNILPKTSLPKIVPHLWYPKEAEEAARFYAAVFPDSHVGRVTSLPADSAIGPAGSIVIVDFRLFGQTFMAMSAGPNDPFNEAISFRVNCSSQSEIDTYWNALRKNGGKPQACGWIVDKYGLRWQIVPTVLADMMSDPDKKKAGRVAAEMLKQVKFDIAKLMKAFDGC
jgi:predicted 3-demethylubiquinone-9 3-methyltransferase (glyoxalase superfamily)